MLLFILCHPKLCDIISRKFRCSTLFSVLMLFDAFDVLCLWLTSYGWWLTLNRWPFCFWLALKVLRVLSGRWSAIQLLSIKCSGKIWRLNWRVEEPKTRHYVPLKRSFQIMWTTVHHCIVHIFTKWIYQICLIVISLTSHWQCAVFQAAVKIEIKSELLVLNPKHSPPVRKGYTYSTEKFWRWLPVRWRGVWGLFDPRALHSSSVTCRRNLLQTSNSFLRLFQTQAGK